MDDTTKAEMLAQLKEDLANLSYLAAKIGGIEQYFRETNESSTYGIVMNCVRQLEANIVKWEGGE